MAETKGVSFRPSDFSAGGFMDDVDARVLAARIKPFDYNGTVSPPVTAISLLLQDVNDEERTTEQFYSIGPSDKFTPSTDGKRAVPTGEGSKVAATSNGAMLMSALLTAGFPEDKLGDDISILDGGVFHVNQTAAPKRKFKEGSAQKDNATILLPTKIVTLPWDVPAADKKKLASAAKAAASTVAAGKPAGAPAATAAVEGDTAAIEAAVAFVIGQLAANDGTVNKNTLPTAAFKLQGDPNRNAITQLVAKESFLADAARPWQYADGVLSMG